MEQGVEIKIQNLLGIFYNSKKSYFLYCDARDLKINIEGEAFVDTSIAKFYSKNKLEEILKIFPEHTWVTEEMLNSEMCNSQNNGYLGNEKAQIMLSDKVNKIGSINNIISEYSDLSRYYDDQPIKAMTSFSDVIYTRDYEQAARAYNDNKSFFFPLSREQIQKIKKTSRKKFKQSFIIEIKKCIKNKKII